MSTQDDNESTLKGLGDFAEALLAEEQDSYTWYTCPICLSENSDQSDCGCFADLHYGSN